jgi:hypothetical protein
LKAFDHALLIGGAAMALVGGVTAAELGLAPIHQALAQTAPSLDTMAADAPGPIQADLQSESLTTPPAVIVPVSAPTPPRRHTDAVDDQPPAGDEAAQQADVDDTQDVAARDPSVELNPAPQAHPEIRDAESDESSPVTPG